MLERQIPMWENAGVDEHWRRNVDATVMLSEVAGSRRVTFKVLQRDSSTPLRCAQKRERSEKFYDRFRDAARFVNRTKRQTMELKRRSQLTLQVQLTEPESSGRWSLKIKSRLFIRETAQPEKPL
jgi:hypothetical protein